MMVATPLVAVLARFDSLDALFRDLHDRRLPLMPYGGEVWVHPSVLDGESPDGLLAIRQRVGAYGLRLMVHSGLGAEPVELHPSGPAAPAEGAG